MAIAGPAVLLPGVGVLPVPAPIPAGAVVGNDAVAAAAMHESEVVRRSIKRRTVGAAGPGDDAAVAEAVEYAFRVKSRRYGGAEAMVLPQAILQVRRRASWWCGPRLTIKILLCAAAAAVCGDAGAACGDAGAGCRAVCGGAGADCRAVCGGAGAECRAVCGGAGGAGTDSLERCGVVQRVGARAE